MTFEGRNEALDLAKKELKDFDGRILLWRIPKLIGEKHTEQTKHSKFF